MELALAVVKDIHIRIADDVHRKLKVKAAANDKSIRQYLDDLLIQEVAHVKIPRDWVEEGAKK